MSKPCDAATNMAIDEALLLSYQERDSEPVLRLYGWKPAAVSIGVSQDPQELFHEHLLKKPVPFVRRPTGGGIIYHKDELTYSVVACAEDLELQSMSVKTSYEVLTSFLIRAYENLGLKAGFAKYAGHPAQEGIASICFARNEEYDILVNGRKLGGSAQKRSHNIILQHGSIPLTLETDGLKNILRTPSLLLGIHSSCLQEALGKKIDLNELKNKLTDSFCSHFEVELRESGLTARENQLVQMLREKKYSTVEWNVHKTDLTKSPDPYGTQTVMA